MKYMMSDFKKIWLILIALVVIAFIWVTIRDTERKSNADIHSHNRLPGTHVLSHIRYISHLNNLFSAACDVWRWGVHCISRHSGCLVAAHPLR